MKIKDIPKPNGRSETFLLHYVVPDLDYNNTVFTEPTSDTRWRSFMSNRHEGRGGVGFRLAL